MNSLSSRRGNESGKAPIEELIRVSHPRVGYRMPGVRRGAAKGLRVVMFSASAMCPLFAGKRRKYRLGPYFSSLFEM
jgi:hypothetical protein